MDYKSAIQYIQGLTNYEKSMVDLYAPGNIDLHRVEQLLELLDSPHVGPSIIHIAGTKGKGSTAAMISSVLSDAGYRTGLYTSPHLHTFRERVKVDGQMISPGDFALTLEEIIPAVEKVDSQAEHGTLTTFEVLTALAFCYFDKRGVEMEVLEVGVGGRLDATNVASPNVCVITSISRDHTELLGDSLAEIASEKAGIIKPGSLVVSAPQPPEVSSVLFKVCAEKGAHLRQVAMEVGWEIIGADADGQRFHVHSESHDLALELPLLGDHQLENAATAIVALEELERLSWRIPIESIHRGLRNVSWPGRLEILSREPFLVVDGAHNGYSARKLRDALIRHFQFEKAVFIIGVSSGKNVADIAQELLPMASEIIITRSRHPRAADPSEVSLAFQKPGIMVRVVDGVQEALRLANDSARSEDLICATGSLFVVGEVIEAARHAPVTAIDR